MRADATTQGAAVKYAHCLSWSAGASETSNKRPQTAETLSQHEHVCLDGKQKR